MISKMVSSPTRMAPASRAAVAKGPGEGQITAIFRLVLTGWGSWRRLRTTGPFFKVRILSARSYFEDVGERPTSKAMI